MTALDGAGQDRTDPATPTASAGPTGATALAAPAGAATLADVLRQAHHERFTGRLGAVDAAGVEILLADGLVTAALTPAAPGPDSLLLKSGRVNQADWSRALDTAGDSGRLDETLIARSLVGTGDLEVTRVAALFDGMFAVYLDAPEDWQARPAGSGAEPALPLRPGVPPAVLLAEAARRHAQLARRWGPPAQLARVRPQATAKAAQIGAAVIQRHREILLCANGRRTPRDIAFVLGCGVYAVMIDIGRLEKQGLLETREQSGPAFLPSVAPRRVEPGDAPAPPVNLPSQLPQRNPRAVAVAQPEGMTPYPKFDRSQADRLKWRLPDHSDPDVAGEPPRTGTGDDSPNT